MRVHAYRSLGLMLGLLLVLFGAWNCSDSTGMGTLSMFMGFDNASLSAGTVAPLDEDFGSADRTPISDLIISFSSVTAWSCTDDDEIDDDNEGDDEDSAVLNDDDDEDEDDENDEDCDHFTVMNDSTVTMSAGDLDTVLAGFVGSALLPEGDYDFIVLGNAEAWVVTAAGETLDAKIPSGRLKVKAPFTILDGNTTDLVLVWNINRSVVETPPGSENFILKPVIHSQIGWDHDDDDDDEDDD